MRATYRRFQSVNSLGVLGLLVFVGVLVTTVAQAEDGDPIDAPRLVGEDRGVGLTWSHNASQSYPWLFPRNHEVRTLGSERHDSTDLIHAADFRLRFNVGGSGSSKGWATDPDDALRSDTMLYRDIRNDPMFSLSIGGRW